VCLSPAYATPNQIDYIEAVSRFRTTEDIEISKQTNKKEITMFFEKGIFLFHFESKNVILTTPKRYFPFLSTVMTQIPSFFLKLRFLWHFLIHEERFD